MKEQVKMGKKNYLLDSLGRKELEIVKAIALVPEPTRARIADFTSMSTVSVTSLLNRLMDGGIVHRGGKTDSSGGRRPTLYRFNAALWRTIGIFIEADCMDFVVTDPSGEVIETRERSFVLSVRPEDHLQEIMDLLTREIGLLLAGPLADTRVLTIGIAPPGMVDTDRGVWLHGLQLSGIEHVDLRGRLQQAYGAPVVVEDPARALAWLHARKLPPQESQEMLLLYLSNGVGVGAILRGELYRGHNGLAGEIGHLVVDPSGDRCSCGNRGCLETVVSVPSILRRFRRRLDEKVISSLQRFTDPSTGGLTLDRIREAGLAGDRLTVSTLFEIGSSLGDACAVLVKLYNPRSLLVAGPAAGLMDLLREPIGLRMRQQVLPEMLADLRLDAVIPIGSADEALGAAHLAQHAYWLSRTASGVPPRATEE